MSKKGRLIYKLITSATIILPTSIYLILSATLFAVTPDVTVYAEIDDISIFTLGKGEYMLYSENTAVSYSGVVIYNDSIQRHGVVVDTDDIVRVGRDYYSFRDVNGVVGFHEITRREIRTTESYRVPLAVVISIVGGLIAFLIVQGKMNWHKDHPRAAAFVALLTATVILFIISVIVNNMLNVFIIATVSWGAYCLEYMAKENMITQQEADKADNDITTALKKALGL